MEDSRLGVCPEKDLRLPDKVFSGPKRRWYCRGRDHGDIRTLNAFASKAAREITRRAAATAAVTAGSLAIPPGPLAWLTIVPELVAVGKIQAQMVSDIAGVYGKTASRVLRCEPGGGARDRVVRADRRLKSYFESNPQ
jgi:hypothetical protein